MKVIRLISFSILTLIGITGCTIRPHEKQAIHEKIASSPTAIPPQPDQGAIENQAKEIFEQQTPVREMFEEDFDKLEGHEKRLRFMNSMTPLGIFDPFNNPSEEVDVKALSNFLLGMYGKAYEVDVTQLETMNNAVIRYGQVGMSGLKFYQDNQASLQQLVKTMLELEDLEVLGDFGSNLIRYNQFYGDIEDDRYWYIPSSTDPFKQEINMLSVPTEELNAEFFDLILRAEPLQQQMLALDIETMYRCEDVIILIFAGIANNAYGYVYNGDDASAVNCGELQNRFRLTSTPVADKWVYWVGK